jgi:hypothetical protein
MTEPDLLPTRDPPLLFGKEAAQMDELKQQLETLVAAMASMEELQRTTRDQVEEINRRLDDADQEDLLQWKVVRYIERRPGKLLKLDYLAENLGVPTQQVHAVISKLQRRGLLSLDQPFRITGLSTVHTARETSVDTTRSSHSSHRQDGLTTPSAPVHTGGRHE